MMASPFPHVGSLRIRMMRLLALLLLLPIVGFAQRTQQAPTLPSASELKLLRMDQLMDLVVTSVSKRPEKLSEAASSIQVITNEDIRRSGATSLPQALRLASNLEVAQIDSRQWAISARGFNNVFADKMLVLVDGRTVYTPLYAGVYWDVQDTLLADLDRIEVISGPGATQWGANAVNGVINITTKSAQDTQGGLVTATGGSFLEGSAGVRYGGQIAPGVYYRVYGKHTEHGESLRPDGSDGGDNWNLSQGGFRVDATRGANQFTWQGDAYSGEFGLFGTDSVGARGRNLLGRWTREMGNDSNLQAQVYYDHTHRTIPASFTQTLDTYDFDLQHRLAPGDRHAIVWGLGYRVVNDDIINTPANAFLPPYVSHEWFNVFAQDEIVLVEDRLRLMAGTKLEHNDYTGFELEPSVRLAFTPDKTRTWWAAISRALRTPSRIDRDLYSPAVPPYRVAGGDKVIAEKLVAYELGYRQQLTSTLSLSLSSFYHNYDDLRSLEPINPPAPFPIERSSELRGYSSGAELVVEWQPTDRWRLFVGYNELRVHSEPQPGSIDRGSDRTIARDANRQLIVRSWLNLSEHWEFDATGRYVGPIDVQRLPGYCELDLRLGWRPAPSWELALVGQNLLHDQHAEYNAMGGRREIPRSGYVQATWRF